MLCYRPPACCAFHVQRRCFANMILCEKQLLVGSCVYMPRMDSSGGQAAGFHHGNDVSHSI